MGNESVKKERGLDTALFSSEFKARVDKLCAKAKRDISNDTYSDSIFIEFESLLKEINKKDKQNDTRN